MDDHDLGGFSIIHQISIYTDIHIALSPNTMDLDLPLGRPNSIISKKHTSRTGTTYQEAIYHGDPLLFLDKSIRTCIFEYVLSDYPELSYLEVPDTKDFTYPCHTQFNDLWYTETCEIMIKNATFSISSDAAIFNLMVFLNEFKAHESYENVLSLELTGLDLFEKGEFSSNATKHFRRCPNLRSLSLIMDLNDLVWTYARGGQELDMDAMTKKYDLAIISQLSRLQTVTLNLKPCMSLHKRLVAMESARKQAECAGFMASGLDSFWGLKDWLEFQAIEQMRLPDVRCPQLN
jgi:hypothetical protein